MKGLGTVEPTLEATGGRVQPGLSSGILKVTGNYAPGSNGTLEVEIGGATPGSGHDQLDVGTTASLDGTLDIVTPSGFTPTPGQSFTILKCGPVACRSGQFDNVQGTIVGSGQEYQVRYNATDVTLQLNTPPEATDDTAETDEDTPLNDIDVLSNDEDADGDSLSVSNVTQPSHGSAEVVDGKVNYTPNADYNGPDSFSYTVSDGNGGTDTADVSITVKAVNDAPVAQDDTAETAEDTAKDINVLDNDTDVDGDSLTVSSVGSPNHGTATKIDGTINYTPNADYNGPDSFNYTVSDGNGGTHTATVSITVTAVNDAPVAEEDSYEVNEDQALSVDAPGVLDNDTDVDNDKADLEAILVDNTGHGDLTLNADGSFSYTPDPDFFGDDSFTYKANDGTDDSNTVTVSITVNAVNDAPVAMEDSYSTDEDTTLSVDAPAVLENDTDVDNANLTAAQVSGPDHGTLTLNADGSLSYKPNEDFFGDDSFTYKASDGQAESDVVTVSLKVNAVNDAPDAVDDSLATNEDTAGTGNVLTNDTDVDNPSLTAVLVSGPSHGTLDLNDDGSYTYTPAEDYNGPDSFSYNASDGTDISNTATVSITVNAVNDAPAANPDTKMTDEDTPLSFPSSDLVSNDDEGAANESTQTLTVTEVFDGTHGTVGLGSDGNITFTPEANYSGEATFTYRVCDDGSPSECSVQTATVNVTVNAVNDEPVAENDTATTDEDTANDIAAPGVLGNDTDIDDDSLTAVKVTDPAHGSVTLNDDGSFTYTPNANYSGPDSFTYKANDGTADSNVATVSITVTAVNDAPVAEEDSYEVAEDQTFIIAEPGVLANDTDVDNPAADLTAVQVSGPAHGTLTLNGNGSFAYTPNEDFFGDDSFTYKASDGQADSEVVTVSIKVNAVNHPPVAEDDSVETGEDTPRDIAVLDNDEDIDGDSLSVSSFTEPANGTVSQNSDGTLRYTPDASFNGTDTFDYTVSDGNGGTDTATVSITVKSVNPDPVVTNLQGADTANEGETKAYTFQITDEDSSSFTFASGSPDCGGTNKGEVVNGTAQINGNNGSFECRFLDGGMLPAQVTVSAQIKDDGQASSDVATKNVSVSNVAPKIESLSGPAQVLTNQPVTFTGTHSDPAGLLDNPFTWQWSGGISTDTDKNSSFVTKFSACGPQNVKATVTDKDGGISAEATLSNSVQAYNGNFLPPSQTGKDNMVRKGQVVPVKISVTGCDGINLAGLSPYIQLFSGDPTVAINEADFIVPTASVSADTGQIMRPDVDGYIYNLKVPSDTKATVGAKYYIRVSPFGIVSGQHMIISIQIRK